MKKIFSFLFSFRGRMNRRNFLISILSKLYLTLSHDYGIL